MDLKAQSTIQIQKWFTLNDYEYRNEADDFPQLFAQVPPSQSVSYDVWWQLRQTVMVYKVLRKSQAAGGIVVFNMGYDRLSGLYSFPVMPYYNAPNLYVDRVSGAKVIQDAKAGKQATIKLLAKVEPAETYQLIGYLPGQHCGTQQDKKVLTTIGLESWSNALRGLANMAGRKAFGTAWAR